MLIGSFSAITSMIRPIGQAVNNSQKIRGKYINYSVVLLYIIFN